MPRMLGSVTGVASRLEGEREGGFHQQGQWLCPLLLAIFAAKCTSCCVGDYCLPAAKEDHHGCGVPCVLNGQRLAGSLLLLLQAPHGTLYPTVPCRAQQQVEGRPNACPQ